MKALIQRVKQASVSVDNNITGEIEKGLLVFLGVDKQVSEDNIDKLLPKLLNYRIFPDAQGKMNCSLADTRGGILVVSQFTLSADTQKGLRPSFSSAASPNQAKQLYQEFLNQLKLQHSGKVATGIFAADMQVSLINDGPVTFLLDV